MQRPRSLRCSVLQRRWYTPPSRRTWSKQHYRIRTPRPLTDRFDLSRVQPQKEWWRERRVAPATFFGFPDVTKAGMRGGSLYTEQMDAVTLAVLADKCVQENIWDPEIWLKFSWRAQQLSTRTQEPDLCYIFRAFARADWFDQNLLTTYLGRLHRRLPQFQLPDVTVLLEAFANPRFRQGEYLQRSLTHMALLLQHRDDASVEDLARTCVALRNLHPQPADVSVEVQAGVLLLAEALLLRELSELSPAQAIGVLDALVCWGLVNSESHQSSNAAADLCWSLARELKGKLRSAGRENPEDLALLAMALSTGKVEHEELWQELVTNLELEMHRMSGSAASRAAYASSRFGHRGIKLYENAARLLGEEASKLSAQDCAYAAGAFLRGPGSLAEQVVLKGPVGARILELGLASFDTQALTLMMDSLSRAPPSAWGVEALAASVLQELHQRGPDMAADELAVVVRSLGYLQPEVPEVLESLLEHAIKAAKDQGSSPRFLAMLCQGIAMQPSSTFNVSERLETLLPEVHRALQEKPTAESVVQILWSLSRCTASRDAVLTACDEVLTSRAAELSAEMLLRLAEGMAAVARTGWSPSQSLVKKVSYLLDMKRYDLPAGKLWRAAEAFQVLGVPQNLRLEDRDKKAAAKLPRRQGSQKLEQS